MKIFDPVLRPATERDVQARWGGARPGERFRCYLCGHKFIVGDLWRYVYANGGGEARAPAVGHGNFMTCAACDGLDVLERWGRACEEADRRFWWLSQ
jgi:hypothetical protein